MWYECVCRVAVPTKLRVERWSFSFMELLNDPLGAREFMTYLEKEFSGEEGGREGGRGVSWYQSVSCVSWYHEVLAVLASIRKC